MKLKTKQTLAVVLSITGAVGTLATALLVREAAKKEQETYQTLLPFKKGNIKDILMLYKVPIAVGTLTIGSIIGSSVMSHKAQVSLISMATMADQGWRKYKNQVKDTLGFKAHNDVITDMAKKDLEVCKLSDDYFKDLPDNRKIYYEEHVGHFTADPEKLAYAYIMINEYFNSESLSGHERTDQFDLYSFLEFASVDNVKSLKTRAEKWGWSLDYLMDGFGWSWVHMHQTIEKTEDGIEFTVLTFVEEPIMLELDEYDPLLDAYEGEYKQQLSLKNLDIVQMDDDNNKKPKRGNK